MSTNADLLRAERSVVSIRPRWWPWIGVMAALLAGIGIVAVTVSGRSHGMTLEFTVPNVVATDIDISPDGRQIAISGGVMSQRIDKLPDGVIDVSSRRVAFTFPPGARNTAWSRDGTRLAVAVGTRIDGAWADIVEYENLAGLKPISALRLDRGGAGSLTYDSLADLYACTDIAGVERFFDSHVFVWWNRDGRLQNMPQEICTSLPDSAVSVSTASVNDRLRLAAAYSGRSGVRVYSVMARDEGEQEVQLEFSFPDQSPCWVRLSPSGKHLAILSPVAFKLFDLQTDPPSIVHTETGASIGPFFAQRQPLDVSADGRRVAYILHDRVEVRRIDDGALFSSAPGRFLCVSLSGDGRALAAVASHSHSLNLYRIPGDTGGKRP